MMKIDQWMLQCRILKPKVLGTKESFFQSLIRNFGVPMGGKRGVIIGSGKADD